MKILLAISVTIQSIPSKSPSPVTAEQAIIPQCLVSTKSNSRYSRIYYNVKEFYISYLLPNNKINLINTENQKCCSNKFFLSK